VLDNSLHGRLTRQDAYELHNLPHGGRDVTYDYELDNSLHGWLTRLDAKDDHGLDNLPHGGLDVTCDFALTRRAAVSGSHVELVHLLFGLLS
jgi:hypothetical protein